MDGQQCAANRPMDRVNCMKVNTSKPGREHNGIISTNTNNDTKELNHAYDYKVAMTATTIGL